MSTARAGNVIGGGDFSNDRIIPDCVRAVEDGRDIIVRNPHSTRPYQHVLEPLAAYLMIAQAQYEDPAKAGYYNVGPDDSDCYTTGDLVTLFCDCWNRQAKKSADVEQSLSRSLGENDVVAASLTHEARWIDRYDGESHEANFLKLDCSKLKTTLGWKPRWSVAEAMERIVEWTGVYFSDGNVAECMDKQIGEFFSR